MSSPLSSFSRCLSTEKLVFAISKLGVALENKVAARPGDGTKRAASRRFELVHTCCYGTDYAHRELSLVALLPARESRDKRLAAAAHTLPPRHSIGRLARSLTNSST